MIENIDLSLVNWSRAQFALTAIYHWLFVPLTLGLSFILVIMETKYYRTGSEVWKKITKFWMKLFGINFAIGVATGIILEFEFGTNWSKYSWFAGDIFGAPLAVEGIMAFFLESTFVAVMFFGWGKVSKKFHLASTWLVAIGANLSALWILVANAWMENPVGMLFNPETARNEMQSFRAVLFNPVAMEKFFHTITSGFVLASMFVLSISSWFLLKNREKEMALKSIAIASVFGFFSSVALIFTGDISVRTIAEVEPVKFAAMEALYEGDRQAGLTLLGFLKDGSERDGFKEKDIVARIEIPGLLSVMTAGDRDAFVPGLKDLLYGNEEYGIMPASEKIERGKGAREVLASYKEAVESGDELLVSELRLKFEDRDFQENWFRYFGYSFLKRPADIIPNVHAIFYSFHLMVFLGFLFTLVLVMAWYFSYKKTIDKKRWFLRSALFIFPLPFLASELGWLVTEMGRQPWLIRDLLPVTAGVSNISASAVQTTFVLFALLFTALLIAEVSIMVRQIKDGSKIEEV
ncbi:MAG TPA: cytochrome ubiquinol oxidase subunit I [Bacteroidales bacterium]|nr:cytochrome ubiquinol oxidase subunit I [Bacteroidales bacterium]